MPYVRMIFNGAMIEGEKQLLGQVGSFQHPEEIQPLLCLLHQSRDVCGPCAVLRAVMEIHLEI